MAPFVFGVGSRKVFQYLQALVSMADISDIRKTLVQSLRKAGRACGVELIRDTAARDKVQEFARLLQASGGPAESKQAAAAAFEAYEETWPTDTAAAATEPPPNGFRLRGKSVLLTYNWDNGIGPGLGRSFGSKT